MCDCFIAMSLLMLLSSDMVYLILFTVIQSGLDAYVVTLMTNLTSLIGSCKIATRLYSNIIAKQKVQMNFFPNFKL